MKTNHAGGQPKTPYVGVQRAAAQTLTTTTNTAIVFDTTDTDRFKMLGTTASQLIVPKGWDGLYLIVANVSFAAKADATRRYTWFDKNSGGSILDEQTNLNWSSGSLNMSFTNTGLFRLVAGDFIEVFARQDSGANLGVLSVPTVMAWIAP